MRVCEEQEGRKPEEQEREELRKEGKELWGREAVGL
jgi:hypothetical protein